MALNDDCFVSIYLGKLGCFFVFFEFGKINGEMGKKTFDTFAITRIEKYQHTIRCDWPL